MVKEKEILIKSLIDKGYLKTPLIIDAFKSIDRKDFVLEGYQDLVYINEALPIGYNQTISQPLTVAFMLEELDPRPGEKVLDVGSGSSWTTALLAYIVSQKSGNPELSRQSGTPSSLLKTSRSAAEQTLNYKQSQNSKFQITSGLVIGIERIAELVEFGRKNLKKYKFSNARIIQAGEKLGYEEGAPYDKILVSATIDELPQELLSQLKIGGRLVIPIKNSIWKIDKVSSSKIEKQEYFGFSFVPLVKD